MKFTIWITGFILFTNIFVLQSKLLRRDAASKTLLRTKRQTELGQEITYFDKNVMTSVGRSFTTYLPRSVQEGAPTSPEIVRLRTDYKTNTNEGRVEVYDRNSKRWGLVCDDYWNLPDANATCRQLGFQRAAREANRDDKYGRGNWTDRDYVLDRIKCRGQERNIFHCSYALSTTCGGKSAGVSCIFNPGCPHGWLSFGGACYQINIENLEYKEARKACENQNSKLTYILRASENNFLSNTLYTQFKKISSAWTGGYYADMVLDTGKIEKRWNWYSTIHNVDQWNTSNLWFPGFGEQNSDKRPIGDVQTKSCVALNRLFADSHKSNSVYDVNYYWWDNLSCKDKLPFICQKNIPIGRSNCYEGTGADYRGTISRTDQGTSCAKWSDPGAPYNERTHPNAGLGNHNYCRNPDDDEKPWCYVQPSNNVYGYCAMVKCSNVINQPVSTETPGTHKPKQCGQNFFHCPSAASFNRDCLPSTKLCDQIRDCPNGEDENPEFCRSFSCKEDEFFCSADTFCILKKHVCDGKKHCRDGADERNCTVLSESDVIEKFEKFDSKMLAISDKRIYANIGIQKCVALCRVVYPEFPCRSFNYWPTSEKKHYSQCQLMKVLHSEMPNKLISIDFPGAHYSLKVDCKDQFQCPSGMCIGKDKQCDGRNDCGDNSDEKNCTTMIESPFEIRLTGSKNDYEGKIEIRYEGEWGYVCDDEFDQKAADVVCNQLGFDGAVAAVPSAGFRFGKIQNPNILLDNVKCVGTEESIEDCDHNPWRKHNCRPEEIAGVVCKVDRPCLISEFRCKKDKICIKIDQICNGKNDCSDGSDEPEGKCDIKIKLVNGPDSNSGRVQIQIAYTIGTVCRDRFDNRDAAVICRMLGIDGLAQAVTDSRFGEGIGEILLSNLNCNGSELDLSLCTPLNWGDHRCSHLDDVGVICGLKSTLKPEITTVSPNKKTEQVPGVTCGKRPITQGRSRIVGGFETIYGAFPWQVGVRLKVEEGDIHWCGGTILSEDWILSAGHCYGQPKNEYLIRTGDWNNVDLDTYEQTFEIEELLFHPNYRGPPIFDSDLVLIKIKRNSEIGIMLNNHVQPACLPEPGMVPDVKTKCYVSGWGETFTGGTTNLLAAEVPLVKHERCKQFYKDRMTERMQCAGYEAGGIDTCQGDSGGPLICKVNGIYTVFGATSWGDGCAQPQSPGVYTKVQVLRDWVKQVTGF